MSRKDFTSRRLGFEGLEGRRLMAGDVGVELVNGVLNITGDDAGNHVQVKQLGDGEFAVNGLYSSGGQTRLNGKFTSLEFSKVRSINAEMNKGNDRLDLVGTNDYAERLKGDLDIRTNGGNDVVTIANFWVNEDASVSTDDYSQRLGSKNPPQGEDLVDVANLVVYGRLGVTTGGESDTIRFNTLGSYDWNTAHEGYLIDSGAGSKEGDVLELNRLFTWAGIDIRTSEAADKFEGETLLAYNGNLTIRTGGGNDRVELTDSNMDWQLTEFDTSVVIDTGSGHDAVTLEGVTARGDISVRTSSGNDSVKMFNVHARETLFADLGSGDDYLEILKSSAAVAFLHGNSHSKGDTLHETSNAFGSTIGSGWETIL